MKKRNYILIIFMLITVLSAHGQEACRVYGTAEQYAGKTLEFFLYEDFLSEKTQPVFVMEVDNEGQFNTGFEVDQTRPVYCLAGIYKFWFLATPGGNYELMLPDFIEKTKMEEYNPYFQPILLMLGVKAESKKDVNKLVNGFDYSFNSLLDSHMVEYMTQKKQSGIVRHIDSLKQKYPDTIPAYFASWKKYRFAMLRRMVYERNHRFVINKYLQPDSVHYQNTAYIELFKDVFKDYFDHFLLRPDGKELLTAVNDYKSPQKISKFLSRMFELDNPALREYAMIKGLSDAYYRDNYKKNSLLICLDSIAEFSKFPEHRIAAKNMHTKLTHLGKGTPAPEMRLTDPQGDSIRLEDFTNHYTYLAFFHTELTPCRKQIGPLHDMASKHEGDFKVLLVLMDEDREMALKNIDAYRHKNMRIAFPAKREKVKEIYELTTYPLYYLIGTDGKLIFSPSPAPTENFENYFFDFVLN
ncbi:MAG: TlpA family protein disulfide reductase [Bacteroidales bacterium]